MAPYQKWVYVIPGFMQTRGTPTRLTELWSRLHREFSGEAVVQLQPWKSDWESEAEFISRMGDGNPFIYVVAYSWGAGYGFIQLAKRLKARGLFVARAWLLDPVYRHSYMLGQWRAFIPGIPITIPRNVDRVTWWRQRESLPMGHDLRAAGKDTKIDEPRRIKVEHTHMDDHPQTLMTIYRQVKREMNR